MTYALSFPVTSDGAVKFEISANDISDFIDAYRNLDGNTDWLVAQIRSQVGKLEAGQALVVVTAAFPTAIIEAVQPPVVERVDPWGAGTNGSAANQAPANTFPADTTTAAPFTAPSGTVTVNTPNGAQTWQLNPPNAPSCQHGEPAAYVIGSKKNGGTYKAYRCAKGAGQDWKSKCEFNQWA